MKWLVTGGCGFIGTNFVSRLLALGEKVYIIDNLSASGIPNIFGNIQKIYPKDIPNEARASLIIGDIRDKDLAIAAGSDADVIVHLAASTGVLPSIENPGFDCDVNVIGTLNYLESARHNSCKAFVLASSGAPLGEQLPPIHEDMVPKPISPYGASKLSGEAYCSAFHGSFGIRAMAFRFSNVYGPNCKHKESVIARFIKRAISGKPLIIYGDGSQTRDFIHVEDLVNAIILSVENGQGGHIYQIATQVETPILTVANIIKRRFEDFLSREVSIIEEAFRKGEVMKNYADISKAANILGWQPERTLERGIYELIDWFVQEEDFTN